MDTKYKLKREERRPKLGIEWREYDRITPGVYRAYSIVAKRHFDRSIRRWVCFVRWNVLSDDLSRVVARVPLWWNLGNHNKPRATHRGKYLREWVRANGGPPSRGDRLSPQVFRNRMARVEVDDTDPKKSPIPYSVVRKIIAWETAHQRVTQSTSHTVKEGKWKEQDNE